MLTYESGAPVPHGVALVAGHGEGGQPVEQGLQKGLQPGRGRVGGVEQVEDLGAGRPEVARCRTTDSGRQDIHPLDFAFTSFPSFVHSVCCRTDSGNVGLLRCVSYVHVRNGGVLVSGRCGTFENQTAWSLSGE